jgi:dolichol-phosphate mannosyltransferase
MKDVIILPTYNERENVGTFIPKIFSTVPNIWVTVMDDNSPDGTADLVRGMMKKYPRLNLISKEKKEGLGKAYIYAFRKVLQDKEVRSIAMMDADFSHDPKYLLDMRKASKTYDVVVGSRYVPGGQTIGWELWRRLLSYWGNVYSRVILRVPIHDLTGGFYFINAETLRKIDFDLMDSSGYAFQIEFKYLLYKTGASFKEVPIIFTNRKGGESKISNHIIREGVLAPWKMLSRRIVMKNCPSCGRTQHFFYTTKNGHDLYRCSVCKMFGLHPLPEEVEKKVYNDHYFTSGEHGFGYVNYDHDKEPMRPVFKNYLTKIETKLGKKGKLLDVGAATGFFMKIAQDSGWHTTGVEISPFAARVAHEKGLKVHHGTLTTISIEEESFDVVTMWDVLEHLTDPENDIVKVHVALRPGGLLLINTPDSSSSTQKFLASDGISSFLPSIFIILIKKVFILF